MTADLVYLVAGASLLLAVLLPDLLSRWAISAPMVLVAVGMAIGLTPLPDGLPLDPQENRAVIEHATELTVIVALMGVGLAIDRPLNLLRPRACWRPWASTWRLLGVTMPLCIAGVALLGWWAGLAPAAAILLGACLAPTDPVLASDVQVAGPQTGDHEVDEEDELRFTLTSEAGLNDGLAFPFVYLAILVATAGGAAEWALKWAGFYLFGKVAIGVVAGILVGRLLAYIAFRAESRALRVAERGESLMALAALITAYGVAEVAQGYGFLAVFACAMTFRQAERSHDYHAAMHQVAERLERLLTLGVLLFLGIALTRGGLDALDWRGVAIGVALLLVIRPLAGVVGLTPWTRRDRAPSGERTGSGQGAVRTLTPPQRWAAAFFGVRGVGSIYYLAYAAEYDEVLATDWLWSTVTFTVVASVLLHGVLATPVMKRVDPEPVSS